MKIFCLFTMISGVLSVGSEIHGEWRWQICNSGAHRLVAEEGCKETGEGGEVSSEAAA